MIEIRHKVGYYTSYLASVGSIVALTWGFYVWK